MGEKDEAQDERIRENREDIKDLKQEVSDMRADSREVQVNLKALDDKVTTGFTDIKGLYQAGAEERKVEKEAKAGAAEKEAVRQHALALGEQENEQKRRMKIIGIVATVLGGLTVSGGGIYYTMKDSPEPDRMEQPQPTPEARP